MAYKVTKLNIGGVVASAGGYVFKLLSVLPPTGLYDAVGKCIATWDELVNVYGMDCATGYSSSSASGSSKTSPKYVLSKYAELSAGTKLIIGEVERIGAYTFVNNKTLTEIVMPDSVTLIDFEAFFSTWNLTKVVFGSGIKSLRGRAFTSCTRMQCYDFTACTSIPTIYSGDVLTVPDGCEIRVPASLVDNWKAATNWTAYADHIVGV
jgi:hypothetical protein